MLTATLQEPPFHVETSPRCFSVTVIAAVFKGHLHAIFHPRHRLPYPVARTDTLE